MTTQQQLDEHNAALRNAVETRLAGRTTIEVGGMVASLHGCKPALEAAAAALADPPRQTCDGVMADGDPYSEWIPLNGTTVVDKGTRRVIAWVPHPEPTGGAAETPPEPPARREEAIAGFKRVVEDARPAREARAARAGVHPSSQAFYDACDSLKAMHRAKSIDYGSADDPLANIRNGAEFVGIEPWRAAMVRLADKVTRLATYNRTGTLLHEGVDDTLLDLASYALLCLVLHREGR